MSIEEVKNEIISSLYYIGPQSIKSLNHRLPQCSDLLGSALQEMVTDGIILKTDKDPVDFMSDDMYALTAECKEQYEKRHTS